ncbi:hypothetical protein F4809DRAFT_645463 [Biscogniauxia mediterranea]|nr:hypothetical protein F4809DRAFT_645463 [Biscogniauxia mediterranea]
MGDFKARFKARLLRRNSAAATLSPNSLKTSLGRDGASSTHSHDQRARSLYTGYAASDEHSDHVVAADTVDDHRYLDTNAKGRNSNESVTSRRSPLKSGAVATTVPTEGEGHREDSNNGNGRARVGKGDGSTSTTTTTTDTGTGTGSGSGYGYGGGTGGSGGGGGGGAITTTTTSTTSTTTTTTSAGTGEGGDGHEHGHGLLAPSQGRAETTPLLANSNLNHSGKDLQSFAVNPLPVNSTTAPAIIAPGVTSALPSINEHPATSPALSEPPPFIPPFHSQVQPPPVPVNAIHLHPPADDIASPLDDALSSPALLTPAAINTPASLAPLPPPSFSPTNTRPTGPPRRQSLLPNRQTTLIKALLETGHASDPGQIDPDQLLPISGNMVTRKIWVRRPMASATLVTINEDDLVDDVRDMILRKYANSLGRQFDAPDLTLRIFNREQQTSRPLQPDEPMSRTIDSYYPGGQTVDDALLIDVPSRRTPKASPNPRFYADDRPHESGTDYFPPYPPPAHTLGPTSATAMNGAHTLHFPPSMTIVSGGQLPSLPSPGGTRRLGTSRPKMQRMHTASPVSTVANGHGSQTGAPPTGTHNYPRPPRSRTHSGASSDQSSHPPAAPPVPTPPPAERTATPPPRVSSPRPSARAKKIKKTIEHPSLPSGLLDGAVPPINVLIVEDNIINLKLLEAFVKRLKVRWQTAMNGREAVNKWRAGGFHLVLMDIQLPVMNGLEATREIRRIEKVNSIGVFSSSASSPPEEIQAEPAEEDKLANTEMFKSPVIIVALTASSLQSDRHEALAAGCNDFLTKPVNFVWLERKVKEWGCMQALIDFDGWRKWKDYSQKASENDAVKKAAAATAAAAAKTKQTKKTRVSMTTAAA